MKRIGVHLIPEVGLEFSVEEVVMLGDAADKHYDRLCRSFSKDGILRGLFNQLLLTNSKHAIRWMGAHEVNVLCKICESPMVTDQELKDRLRAQLTFLNDTFRKHNGG